MSLEIQKAPNNQKPRTRTELVLELKRVADRNSTEFHAFWEGMTQEEKSVLLHGPDEEPQTVSR
jgi:hypothetical protein